MIKITRSNNFRWYWTKRKNIDISWLKKQGIQIEYMLNGYVIKIENP